VLTLALHFVVLVLLVSLLLLLRRREQRRHHGLRIVLFRELLQQAAGTVTGPIAGTRQLRRWRWRQ
jgi:hypothetical protein